MENRLAVRRSFSRALLHSKTLSKEQEELMVAFMLSNRQEIFRVSIIISIDINLRSSLVLVLPLLQQIFEERGHRAWAENQILKGLFPCVCISTVASLHCDVWILYWHFCFAFYCCWPCLCTRLNPCSQQHDGSKQIWGKIKWKPDLYLRAVRY